MDDHLSDRVGFRDIYRAVGESEVRIVAALNATIAPLVVGLSDHEARLRSIEVNGSPDAQEAIRRVEALEAQVAPLAMLAAERERRLTAVEDLARRTNETQRVDASRKEGIAATFSGTQRLIITAAAAGGLVTIVLGILK